MNFGIYNFNCIWQSRPVCLWKTYTWLNFLLKDHTWLSYIFFSLKRLSEAYSIACTQVRLDEGFEDCLFVWRVTQRLCKENDVHIPGNRLWFRQCWNINYWTILDPILVLFCSLFKLWFNAEFRVAIFSWSLEPLIPLGNLPLKNPWVIIYSRDDLLLLTAPWGQRVCTLAAGLGWFREAHPAGPAHRYPLVWRRQGGLHLWVFQQLEH